MMSKGLYRRGEIYWVDFGELEGKDKSAGKEINGKERPALIISIDWYNNERDYVAILPMSSKVKNIIEFLNYFWEK